LAKKTEDEMTYTIVPDIHADLERLNWSFEKAQGSKMIFLGDLIDAGKLVTKPDDWGVLKRVSHLIADGDASCILGNHELNAILFHRRSSTSNAPLRSHKEQNTKQHKSFIEAFGVESSDALSWTAWMLETLPLWLEFDGLRIAHACWSEEAIKIVKKRRPTGHLQLEDLEEVAAKSTEFALAVETITSGPEAKLPVGYSFTDNGGNKREHVRLSWWNAENTTWRKAALSVPDLSQLPTDELPAELMSEIYSVDEIPVLVGHYKMKGIPNLQSANATSLDYPMNKCVYHWSGESTLQSKNLTIEA
jgi:hypothetical protein